MRLFGKVDGVVDRYDRAGWLSMPFDLAWAEPEAPAIGSILVDRVECVPSVAVASFAIPQIVIDDYDLATDEIEISSVEVIP